MPDFAIVDSHVHLYDPDRIRYSWINTQPKLNHLHDLAEFDRARGPVEVAAVVFVEVWADQWGQHLAEAAWVQKLADQDSRLQGIVAAAPLERGAAVEADLERLRQDRNVRAIRRLIEHESAPGFCLQPDFIAGVKLVGGMGLGFDLCVKHWQLKDAAELVRNCPEVRFVLDHIGKPPIKDGQTEPWRSDLKALAELPNVCCKLSGVITEADHDNWSRDQIRPYLEHAIDCFGFDRVMFGSDWPVSELTHSYPEWVEIVDEIVANCSDVELQKLYRDNAVGFYRLAVPRDE